MTQSHIQFEPLILERKTPAEELREIVKNAPYQAGRQTMELVEGVAARLEAPDAPKRWDGVFPWVRRNTVNTGCVVLFSDVLSIYESSLRVWTTDTREEAEICFPYHDGVIITITAGSGDEFPRVVKAKDQTTWLCCGVGQGKSIYLDGGPPNVFTVGEIPRWLDTCLRASPLPPGTVTRITINHTLPTTEQRYSVEFVEPEKPKFSPITVANERVKVGVESEKIRMDYLTLGGSQMFSADEAREIRDAISAALEFGNPTQEQPATEAVAEGLPLNLRCVESAYPFSVYSDGGLLCLTWASDAGGPVSAHLSPADEARLRNLLNQRHANKKGNE